MTREQKIEMVAGTTGHTFSEVAAMVDGNDRQLERMFLIAKATINQQIDETYFETMS